MYVWAEKKKSRSRYANIDRNCIFACVETNGQSSEKVEQDHDYSCSDLGWT